MQKPSKAALANTPEKKRWDGRIYIYPQKKNESYRYPNCKGRICDIATLCNSSKFDSLQVLNIFI